MTVPWNDAAADGVTASDHVRTELIRFVRALRHDGVSVPANAATTAARVLVELGFDDRQSTRTALRAALVTDRDDFETFDRLFATFWTRLTTGLDGDESTTPAGDPPDEERPLPSDPAAAEQADGTDTEPDSGLSDPEPFGGVVTGADQESEGEDATVARYSPTGGTTTITQATVPGTGGLDAAFQDLTGALAGLRGRRWQAGGDRTDARRALRESFATGGAVLSVPERERERSRVRAVLLVDVSRSVLDTVDRGFLIEFLRQARQRWQDVRVFFFDEDLREVTDAVDALSASVALDALERAEAAWGGGTQIGTSLARLHETAPDAVDRRTAVFLVSDGLEMGDVDKLEREVAWLARRGKRVLWLNPLAAADDYEPTARGMAAALPYLDGLFAFAGPADVAELTRQLHRQGPGGRIGYEYDPRRSHP